MRRLRAITYLSPGLPLELFQGLGELLGDFLGLDFELTAETAFSGPMRGDPNPFAEGEMDLGFLCSPSYLYLRLGEAPTVGLAPAGFAFQHPRAEGKPVYFADVVVREDASIQTLDDLRGTRWGYNDRCSLSGRFAIQQHLKEQGHAAPFFGEEVQTGCHEASVQAILGGTIDAASLDSTTLSILRRQDPELASGLRVVQSLGPFPIQPIVLGRHLDPAWAAAIGSALPQLHLAPRFSTLRERFGLDRLVPIGPGLYSAEEEALCGLGELDVPVDRSCESLVQGLCPPKGA